MKSVMNHVFSQVPQAEIQRSSFDRSHGYKTTFNAGILIPFYWDEALPGDTFHLNANAFARLATPLKPIMDNLFLETFFFFVPNRLLWEHWEQFNGAQANPGDSTDYLVPYCQAPSPGGFGDGTIHDYFGLPTLKTGIKANVLHHRAYNKIWNAWFRDQNLQNSVVENFGDGPDNPDDYQLLRRGKRHDYFTSALPWPQKSPDVLIPLGDSAIVKGSGTINMTRVTGTGSPLNVGKMILNGTANIALDAAGGSGDLKFGNNADFSNTGLIADLSDATAATINALREAFQLQRLYERDARGGTRYTEILKAHFGVTSPDARLQRPEYLGGGSTPVNFHPVAQTANYQNPDIIEQPLASLAAFATAAFTGHGFTKSFTEHGVIIGLVCVRADLTYQQGLHRMWSRRTRFDFYWPALSHLGEQEILLQELFAQGTSADDDVFGYQERYAEYRYKPSQITGKFRSNTPGGSLDFWHLAQDFSGPPTLNTSFIQENPPMERIIAVPSEPHFLFDSYISLKCARPMPVYGVPGMIDHF